MKFSTVALLVLSTVAQVKGSVRGTRKRRLQLQLVGFGGEPDPSRFPLQQCQGDCDGDQECDIGLTCFNREAPPPGQPWPEVPGCIGGSDFTAKTDFCILGPVSGSEAAPTGSPTTTPTTNAPTDAPTGAPSDGPTSVPTQEMQSTGPTTEMPSTAPTTATPSVMPSSESYWDLPELGFVGADGNLEGLPLGLCLGDCDTDLDCLDELVCLQRVFNEPIPACRGVPRSSMDYCVLPPPPDQSEVSVTMAPTSVETMATMEMIVALQTVGDDNDLPLGLCQGDCDVDEDCLDALVCFQRQSLEAVPGCAGQGSASYDYCIQDPHATSSPTISILTSAPTGQPLLLSSVEPPTIQPSLMPSIQASSTEPSQEPSFQPLLANVDKHQAGLLGLCEGRCFSDDDCEGELVCMDRDSEDEVPDCGGEPHKADDYCINP